MCAKQIFETISHVFAVNNLFPLGAVQKVRVGLQDTRKVCVLRESGWGKQERVADLSTVFCLL